MTLASRVAFGAAWMVFLRFSVRMIGLVSTLILVRLLAPADFGIVAMATSIFAIIELLTAFSFDVVLIQRQDAGQDEYNAAWTLNVLLGVAAAVVLVLVAYPAAAFYEQPQLAPVIMVLALSAFLQGLANIGLVDFRKYLQFHKEFIFQFAVKVAAFVVTIFLAVVYRSYWALIAGIVTSKLAALVLSYAIHPFRPRLSLKGVHSIIHFSKWLFVNNVTYFIRSRSPDLILGKMSGAAGLGVFSIAYEISNLPTTELIAPINRALLPGFATMALDRDRMGRSLVSAAATLALLSIPAGVGIAATAELFVPLVLGEQWGSAIPLIEILALFGAVSAVQSPVGTALLAAGRPALMAALSTGIILFMLPAAIYFTGIEGPEGMAKALLATTLLFLPFTYGAASRVLGVRSADIARIFARPLSGATVMYLVLQAFLARFADMNQLLLLGAAVLLGAVVYTATVAVMWLIVGKPAGPERQLMELAGNRIRG